jgi:translation initiation factor eIF-2B subunit delta
MHMTKLQCTPGKSDQDSKQYLFETIDRFIEEEIVLAQNEIRNLCLTKINSKGDVILTFGCSLIVQHILYQASMAGKSFRVIVVDSGPRFSGKVMVEFLLKHNIPMSYIYVNAVAYAMKEVTKVLLGAHALLANGYVMASLGSSQVALVAQAYNVPVLVCCETYKFSERVHTDSFVYNEAGSVLDFRRKQDSSLLSFLGVETQGQDLEGVESEGVSSQVPLEPHEKSKNLTVLNLLYDVTPPDFVSLVITEKGILPCSSVPAVIRRNVTKMQLENI